MATDYKFYRVCYLNEFKGEFCPGSEFYYGYDGVSATPSISYFKRAGSNFIFAAWDYKTGTDACIDRALANAKSGASSPPSPDPIPAAIRNATADSDALVIAIEATEAAAAGAAAAAARASAAAATARAASFKAAASIAAVAKAVENPAVGNAT